MIERLVVPAQFGVRFVDRASGRVVNNSLEVRLWPLGRPEHPAAAVANRAGVFVAHPLAASESPQPWVVEVIDRMKRFLPLRFSAQLPSATLHELALLSSPPDAELAEGGVALFSAPTRSLAPGLAALRADLRDTWGQPAAWAVAQVLAVSRSGSPGPTLGWGMADRRGSLLVPIRPPRGRSSAGTGLDQPWTVRLALHYRYPNGTRAAHVPLWDEALGQPDVELLGARVPPQPLDDLQVQAGQTLVVRTAGLSELLLGPP